MEKIGLIFVHRQSTVHSYSNSLGYITMRTQQHANHHFSQLALPVSHPQVNTSASLNNGLITEFVYSASQPVFAQLLLPLLQHLGTQSRWLLWLTPQQKLSRVWLSQSGLPVDKMVQVNQITAMSTVDAMEKALQTGNYSVVLGWLPELNDVERERLQIAARQGGAYGFIMKPTNEQSSANGHHSTVKIHSSVYH